MENGPRTTPDEECATGLVEVRAASPSDVRAIAEFQTACWNEAYRDVVPSDYLDRVDACTRAARWRERIETGSRRVAVGHVGDALAGVVSWATSTEPGVPALELKSLYVAAAHHGTGLAGALLTHALGDGYGYGSGVRLTSTQLPPVSAASSSGPIRTALFREPPAG